MSEVELQDSILRAALQLQRLSAHEQAEAEAILHELERELRALLNSQNLSASGRREIKALIKAAEDAIQARYATVATSLDTRGLVVLVAERTVETLSIISPAISSLTPERLASLADEVLIDGAPSKAWWAKQAEDTAFKFAGQVRQGIINGETQERIVQRIVGRGGEPGIMEIARRNARALVHSSVMTAANDARMATFRKNADMFKGVRWLATLDPKSCPVCAALDGQEWTLDGDKLKGTTVDFRSPPAHWNCRCTLTAIPRTDAIDEVFPGMSKAIAGLGGRSSSFGPTGPDTSFAGFFARLSPAQQDAMFGKGRAALWRAGKITIRDMVSGTGRELTLDELKAA